MAGPRPKGLLFAGGRLPHVANRPVVLYGLDAMRRAGVREVGIIGGQRSRDAVHELLGERFGSTLRLRYLPGAADPVTSLAAAASFVEDSPCVVQMRDGLVRGDVSPLLDELDRDDLDALLLLDPSDPLPEDVTGLDERRLLRVAGEADPSARLAGVHVLGARVIREARSGGSLSELMERVTAGGGRARARKLGGLWHPVAHSDELLAANRAVLDDLDPGPPQGELRETLIEGRVAIGPDSQLESTVVRGPAVIGSGVELVHAYVGPYTAIGDHVRIEGAEVEHSIVLEGATIKHLRGRIEASVVGRGAKVYRDFCLPHAMRLRLGDGAEVCLD